MVYQIGPSIFTKGHYWVKQCHKPPIWKWFISPFVGEMGDGLLVFYQHTNIIKLLLYDVFWLMMRMMRMRMITIDLVCVLLCSYSNNFIGMMLQVSHSAPLETCSVGKSSPSMIYCGWVSFRGW